VKDPVFSRPVILLLVLCATALFALSMLFSGGGGETLYANKAGPGAYSASAVGYAGFFDLLRRQGLPAIASSGNAISDAGLSGTLIVAEPGARFIASEAAMNLENARRIILVLPKWKGRQDEAKPQWIEAIEPLPMMSAQETLALVPGTGSYVFRKEWPDDWANNEIGVEPSGSGIVQLIEPGSGIKTVVGDGDGALVAEISQGSRKILVLSDPDVMSNHGLMKGDNAGFMIALVSRLWRWENDEMSAPIVFDETVHGFREMPVSPLSMPFRPPFLIVTLLVCASAILMAWTGVGRFGAPRAASLPIGFGKEKLIDNSARLLDYGGHHSAVLIRYLRMTLRSAARALHAPGGLDETSLAEWLDAIGRARGVSGSCRDILRASDGPRGTDRELARRLFKSASEIHRWKEEILNERAVRRRDR
jgi:hypothetical protein